mgnify:CR=1 FL=1
MTHRKIWGLSLVLALVPLALLCIGQTATPLESSGTLTRLTGLVLEAAGLRERHRGAAFVAQANCAGYSASKGIPGVRKAQANYYGRRFGVELDPETEVVMTMGSKEGLASLATAICAPGDVVLAPNPEWVQSLPAGKLPDRTDFYTHGQDLQARVKAWYAATRAAQQLVDEFRTWVERGEVDGVLPL